MAKTDGWVRTLSRSQVCNGFTTGAGWPPAYAAAADLPGISRERGEQLLAQAHQRCPYSNATRNNIDVQLVLGHLRETATR